MIEFYKFILCVPWYICLFVSGFSFSFCRIFGIFYVNNISSANSGGFISNFLICISLISFSYLIALAKTSNTVLLNKSVKSTNLCLVPCLRKKAFNLSPSSIMLGVGFLWMLFMKLINIIRHVTAFQFQKGSIYFYFWSHLCFGLLVMLLTAGICVQLLTLNNCSNNIIQTLYVESKKLPVWYWRHSRECCFMCPAFPSIFLSDSLEIFLWSSCYNCGCLMFSSTHFMNI